MFGGRRGVAAAVVACLALLQGLVLSVHGTGINYKDALTKSIIFLEAQRSGKLPPNHRPAWRGDSALDDGKEANVDLAGGYYDAGDNVKYGLPMAFTVTTLSWAAMFYRQQLEATGELENVLAGIKWGTEYFLKATRKNRLYVQVGDPNQDHQCWTRPEDMQTPRTVLKIDDSTPGTEIAAETSAAMAASSIVFRKTDRAYARSLLNKAKRLFQMAKAHKGTYDGECPFYCSYSGYNDELLWAATWLYIATKRHVYLKYIQEEAISATVSEFSWDLKYAGAQVLLAKLFFEGEKSLVNYKNGADSYICSNIPDSPYNQVTMTPGGMIHLRDGANTQYVTGTAHLFAVYSDILAQHNQKVNCGGKEFDSGSLIAFAKKQMDYLLGENPKGRSYMVGFGPNAPQQPHHRGASVPKEENGIVNCAMSFVNWFKKDVPNPNELTGAIVGGPDRFDNFEDKRWASSYTEPCTYVNSLAVGPLAKLAA
ncbi:endoglucanase 16-like [Pyrus ussuriensis x Pyrus communis]|uniref:Endoglucanase n=1 Tax=Pyrus ussuriensis x Pyrus communis TaxID=2448454 RepID=A0A5N5HII0_9ROSA|nr:endoglucanase 16-like [Pyrus ussuriensis x Pyrus communis]